MNGLLLKTAAEATWQLPVHPKGGAEKISHNSVARKKKKANRKKNKAQRSR
jgi:hypothetical protein